MYLTLNIYNSFILWYNVEKLMINKGCEIMGATSLNNFVEGVIGELNKTGSRYDSDLYYRKVRKYINLIFNALGVSLKEFRDEVVFRYGYRNRRGQRKYIISDTMQTILKNKLIVNNIINNLPKKREIEKIFNERHPYEELCDMLCIINEFLVYNFTNMEFHSIKQKARQKVVEITSELKRTAASMNQRSTSIEIHATYCLTVDMIHNIVNNNRCLGNYFQQYIENILTEVSSLLEDGYIFNLSTETSKGELSEYSIAVLKLLRYSDYLPELLRQVKFETRLNKTKENR